MVTGIVPHLGGPVAQGFPTVLVVGMPDARIVDITTCVGPPDPISQGSSTVLIGGMPTSGLGDMTIHGGVLVTGAVNVLIGGPVVTINVSGDAAYIAACQANLPRIFSSPSGAEWLRQMGLNGHAITLVPYNGTNGYCRASDPANIQNGVGSDSVIQWNPDHHTTDAGLPGAQGTPGSDVILFHEMVHALHNANGDNRNGPYDHFPNQEGSSGRGEERSTVGSSGPVRQPDGAYQNNPPDYSNDVPTENSYRRDQGIPPRPGYYPSNWPGGSPW